MSGVVNSVGKIFKKVTKVVTRVAPVALAVGAVVFTAGSALGALPTWGQAVSNVVSKLGAGELLTRVLSGAVVQAGYGGALGAGLGLVTGKDPLRGAQIGAATGLLSGGLTGGFGGEIDPIGRAISGQPTGFPASQASAPVQQVGPPRNLDPNLYNGQNPPPLAEGGTVGVAPGVQGPAPEAPAPTQVSTAGAGGAAEPGVLSTLGDAIEAKPTVFGMGALGVGQGVTGLLGANATAAAAKEKAAAEARTEAEKRAGIAANYGAGTVGTTAGLLRPGDIAYIQAQAPRPAPSQRFDPRTYSGEYRYNPETGRVEFVQAA